MRNGKLSAPPAVVKREDGRWITQVRKYRLITPLFGGGVEAGKPDPITAVRGASVRGQLRFWWQATRAGHYPTLDALKQAEDCLWGAASKAGLVELAVEVLDEGQDEPPFEVRLNKRGNYQAYSRSQIAPAYAAFPLQPDRDTLKAWDPETHVVTPLRVGVSFQLRLTYPAQPGQECAAVGITDIAREVEASLWAWECFGGVGARTRRGFGALALTHIDGKEYVPPTAENLAEILANQYEQHVLTTYRHDGIARLPKPPEQLRLVTRPRQQQPLWERPLDAWSHLINRLSDFRQWRDRASPESPNQPGRSRWPEPDAIRMEAKVHHPFHPPRLFMKKYPRAVFGLPIVVHFKDREDPEDYTIQGADSGFDRMASPLILRPYRCAADNGEGYIGLALVLEGDRLPPGGIGIKAKRHARVIPVNSKALTPVDIAEIEKIAARTPGSRRSPLRSAAFSKGQFDMLQTFLNYLEQ